MHREGQGQVTHDTHKHPEVCQNIANHGNVYMANDYACIMDSHCIERTAISTNCTCDVNTGTGYDTKAIAWPQGMTGQTWICAEPAHSHNDLDSISSRSDDPVAEACAFKAHQIYFTDTPYTDQVHSRYSDLDTDCNQSRQSKPVSV